MVAVLEVVHLLIAVRIIDLYVDNSISKFGLSSPQLRVFFDLGRLRLAAAQPESSEAVLREFLDSFPDSVYQRDVFLLLDRAEAFGAPQQREQWLAWSKRQSSLVQGDVLFRVGLAEAEAGDLPAALANLEETLLGERTSNLPLRS